MKKLGFLFATIVMIMLFAMSASAKEVVDSGECGAQGDNVTWMLDAAGVLRFSGSGKIQDQTENNNVWKNYYISYIVIEDGITSIGKYAFANCNAEQIELAETILTIKEGAFKNCLKLENIVIPKGVKIIPSHCFDGCSSLKSLILPEGITTINEYAFQNCKNLVSIELPNSITGRFGHGVFKGCSSIKTIDLPENADSTMYLFDKCSSLETVFLGKGYRGNGANYNFRGTDSLKNIYYKGTIEDYFAAQINFGEFMNTNKITSTPSNLYFLNSNGEYYKLIDLIVTENIDNIPYDAFQGYSGIKTVTLGSCVMSIGQGAFSYCKNLSNVKLSEGLKTIGSGAFDYTSINELAIPFSVNSIGYSNGAYTVIVYNHSCGYKFALENNLTYIINNDEVKATAISLSETELNLELNDSYKFEPIITPDDTLNKTVSWHSDNNDIVYVTEIGSVFARGIGTAIITAKTAYGITATCIVNVTHKHNWSNCQVIKLATCNIEGVSIYTCFCDETKTEIIPAINHANATTDVGKAPTSTEVGYTEGKYCPDCKTWIEGHEEIPILHTHSYSVTVNKTATCTTTGTKTYTCTCGDTYTESIPATNHPNATIDAGKAPTATEVGYTEGKYCPDCKIWIEGHAEIPKLEEHKHSYTSTVTKEPTCWREGETTYTCTCGDSYTEAIAKLEHEYRPWETTKNPTCTKPGLEWSYCLICDNDFEREIPAEGHNEYEYTRRATPAEAGAYVVACDKCWVEFSSISFGRPAEYKLSNTKYTYDGKTKTPKLTITTSDGKVLKKGVDYTVELPDDRKSVGIHTYRVVFMGDYLGETKVSYQILPGKTSSVSASQSTSSIKLTWKKVTGATGYRVYQYNSRTGKYKTLKTLTGTSYTVKNLKAGTTYKFAVKAYTKADGETLWAASSKTLTTATKPATPTVKVTAGSGKATLSWSKVTGATGYVIYMEDSFGDFEKVTSTTKTSYTKKSLKKGKTYKFRIKAYKKVDGKYIYSGYKTYSVKVK